MCSGLLWSVLVCSNLFWSVLVCSGVFWSVLVCSGLFWSVLVCSGLFWSVLVCSGLFWCFARYLFCVNSLSNLKGKRTCLDRIKGGPLWKPFGCPRGPEGDSEKYLNCRGGRQKVLKSSKQIHENTCFVESGFGFYCKSSSRVTACNENP